MSKEDAKNAASQSAKMFRVDLAPGETKTIRLGYLVDVDDLGHLYLIGRFIPKEGEKDEWVAIPLQ